MSLLELLQDSTKWLGWASIGLGIVTLISFLARWEVKFRLFGATAFSILLTGSSWAFAASYKPPVVIEGSLYVPIVYDNGNNLVVAQVPNDFSEEAIEPTLQQLAGNLKGVGRNTKVNVRLRKIEPVSEGISRPVILGEVVRDFNQNITLPTTEKKSERL